MRPAFWVSPVHKQVALAGGRENQGVMGAKVAKGEEGIEGVKGCQSALGVVRVLTVGKGAKLCPRALVVVKATARAAP